MQRSRNIWLSAHVYFEGNIYGIECDDIIRNIIDPFINLCCEENIIEKYFFIRYFDYRSHIRIRFYGIKTLLENRVMPLLEKHIDNSTFKDMLNLPQMTNIKLEISKRLLWIPYEPEYERYGGKRAISIAEDYFYYSSITAFKIFRKQISMDISTRLAKGLISMLIVLHVFIRKNEEIVQFILNYCNGYLKYISADEMINIELLNGFKDGLTKQAEMLMPLIEAINQALNNNIILQEPWNEYLERTKEIKALLISLFENNEIKWNCEIMSSYSEVYNSILPSYLHMMNNRLGISVINESYLAYIIGSYYKNNC